LSVFQTGVSSTRCPQLHGRSFLFSSAPHPCYLGVAPPYFGYLSSTGPLHFNPIVAVYHYRYDEDSARLLSSSSSVGESLPKTLARATFTYEQSDSCCLLPRIQQPFSVLGLVNLPPRPPWPRALKGGQALLTGRDDCSF